MPGGHVGLYGGDINIQYLYCRPTNYRIIFNTYIGLDNNFECIHYYLEIFTYIHQLYNAFRKY